MNTKATEWCQADGQLPVMDSELIALPQGLKTVL